MKISIKSEGSELKVDWAEKDVCYLVGRSDERITMKDIRTFLDGLDEAKQYDIVIAVRPI